MPVSAIDSAMPYAQLWADLQARRAHEDFLTTLGFGSIGRGSSAHQKVRWVELQQSISRVLGCACFR